MRTSLWMVVIIVAAWLSFLFGYAVSSHSVVKGTPAAAVEAAPSAGGYGR